jgi:hypothetical protein
MVSEFTRMARAGSAASSSKAATERLACLAEPAATSRASQEDTGFVSVAGSVNDTLSRTGPPRHLYPWLLHLEKGPKMALAKKKRIGKKTISAKQVRKTASGRKRRKSDGTQPPKAVTPTSTPVAS